MSESNILSQFKALGLVPEDADRLEIVSRKVGADQARYYLLGKCYPIAGLNVGIRPCDDPAIVELAKARKMQANITDPLALEIAEQNGSETQQVIEDAERAAIGRLLDDNDPPANGED